MSSRLVLDAYWEQGQLELQSKTLLKRIKQNEPKTRSLKKIDMDFLKCKS